MKNTQTITLSSSEQDLPNRLQKAIASKSLEFHYQPEIDIQSGIIVGLEVLSRWTDDVLGNVNPDEFIRCASSMEWLEELTSQQIEVIFQDLPVIDDHFKNLAVGFNLTPKLVTSKKLFDQLAQLMETRPKGASSIEIELTETAPNISEAELIKGIHRLRELGFRIAMDDFGSGYSSLNRFCKLHFDRIKLDSEVTRQVGSLKGNAAIKMLVQMAKELNIPFTVEGVETAEQLYLLQDLGCIRFQGWYFSKALPLDEILQLSIDPLKTVLRK